MLRIIQLQVNPAQAVNQIYVEVY